LEDETEIERVFGEKPLDGCFFAVSGLKLVVSAARGLVWFGYSNFNSTG
jgi:hypothetical protein